MEEFERMAEETKIAQLQLPDPADADPHPRRSWRAGASMPVSGSWPCSRMGSMTSPWR